LQDFGIPQAVAALWLPRPVAGTSLFFPPPAHQT